MIRNFSHITGIKTVILLFFCMQVFPPRSHCESDQGFLSVKTEHFTFVFKEKNSQEAAELVSFCEEAYTLVTSYFDSYPKEIKCIINGETDQANGASLGNPASIIVNVASPSMPWLGARTESWLRAVLIHELAHYVHINYNEGFFAGLSSLLGEEAKRFYTPFLYSGWMFEGIATNLETIYTNGGRGRNPFFEMYIKAMAIEDSFFEKDQANYASSFPPPGRLYVAGFMLVHYMMRRFGADVFARIHRLFADFPFLGAEKAVISVTGESVSEIYAGMKAYFTDRASPYRLIPGGNRITPKIIGNFYLPLETGSGLVLYRDTLDSRPAIVSFDPVTGREELMLEADLFDSASLSSDESGEIIVFSSATYDFRSHPAGSKADLYLFDRKAGKVNRLTHNGHLFHPALSSNGSRLFACERTGSYSRLVEVEMTSGNISVIFSEKEANVFTPDVSSDGSLIAFSRNIRGMQDIFIMPTDVPGVPSENAGGMDSINADLASSLLQQDHAGDYFPVFQGNEAVIFSSDRGGSLSLYSCPVNGKKLFRIADDPVAAISGRMIGERLIYSSYSHDGYCVKSLDSSALIYIETALPEREEAIPGFRFEKLPEAETCTDLPVPLFWFPYPFVRLSPLAAADAGIGFYILAGSLLRKSWWSINGSFSPEYLQPRITANAYYDFELFSLSFSAKQDFTFIDYGEASYTQDTTVGLNANVPLVSEYSMTVSRYAYIQAGLTYAFRLEAGSQFYFAGAGYGGAISGAHSLLATGGIGFIVSKPGSAYDFFAPYEASIAITAGTPLPVFEGSGTGFTASLASSFNLPSFITHQVISPGITLSYASRNLELQQKDLRLYLNADYLFPIALLDVAFAFGFSLLDLSGRVFWNYGFDLDIDPAAFHTDRYMWAGAELRLSIGSGGYYSFPLVAGIKIRFDPKFEEPFSLTEGIYPYVTVSLGGLSASGCGDNILPQRHEYPVALRL